MSPTSLKDIHTAIEQEDALLIYLSTPDCNVCKVLRPKIEKLLAGAFPEMGFQYVNLAEIPEAAGAFQVFTVPTILVYFDGKETVRKSRNISLQQFAEVVQRPYSLYFE